MEQSKNIEVRRLWYHCYRQGKIMRRSEAGYTLLELVIVIFSIAILLSLLIFLLV